MRIEISNFGPVKNFVFDSKCPMHLIVGTNNVGKSYALTAYYLAICSLLESRALMVNVFSQIELIESDFGFNVSLEKSYRKKLKADATQDIEVTGFFEDAAKATFDKTIAAAFNEKIESSYGDFKSVLSQYSKSLSCSITFFLPGLKFSLTNDGQGFKTTSLSYSMKVISVGPSETKKKIPKTIVYQRKSDDPVVCSKHLRMACIGQAFASITVPTAEITDIYYLPASRSGLYQALSSFGPIIAELSKKRTFLSSKIELPGISWQLSEYYLKLTDINERKYTYDPECFYEKVAKKIEVDILKGSIQFESSTKKLFYMPDKMDLRLELSAASSMVSEIGPIVAYIRYILSTKPALDKVVIEAIGDSSLKKVQANPILIIEEPEAHLHPENQIKMTDIYADLSNFGIKVIMTSHSNYVFNKLSNIIISKVLDAESVKCDMFEETSGGATGVSLDVDEFGLDDQSFIDASEKLLNEKMELFSNIEF
ncbi:AAA family ATPase [Pseudomonas oryzihabitans]|uniref:AAA family ATPase n=1 Tax=Pseudomonas oryzihabitans TaxID=47885 RepID=UPI002857FCDA|nr:AAA family ATPase [Pseudomonas psychrotolerans]MDR6677365.1 hypothetical protein [Pseudomonas psychrotolerans]